MKALKKDPNERYQNATEMIKDLNLALKRPEGGFIEERNYEDSYTRKIPTINIPESNSNSTKVEETEKKKGKIGTFFAEHPKTKIALIVLLFILIFVATLVITLTVINSSTPEDVQIPNVVGISKEEAKQKIEASKLKFNISREEYNAEIEVGYVISQDPAYINNYSVKEGSTVNVVVSKGKELVKMPKVIGMEYTKAEATLRELGIEIEKIEETSQKVESGYVISQETSEGTELETGTKVKLHVSIGTGIKKVTVTSVLGKSKEEAKNTLTSLGLEVNFVEEEDTSKSDGVVLKQSIDAGTSVDEGSAITITINKIEKNKQGTVNINVKSLANTYISEEDPENPDGTSKNVTIKVLVSGDTIYDKKVSRDTENLNLTVEGKGNISIKVYINGILANGKTYTMDLNSENTVLTVQ